jgi:hypothetical protein
LMGSFVGWPLEPLRVRGSLRLNTPPSGHQSGGLIFRSAADPAEACERERRAVEIDGLFSDAAPRKYVHHPLAGVVGRGTSRETPRGDEHGYVSGPREPETLSTFPGGLLDCTFY